MGYWSYTKLYNWNSVLHLIWDVYWLNVYDDDDDNDA